MQTTALLGERFGSPVTEMDTPREYDVGDAESLPYTGEHAWRWSRYTASRPLGYNDQVVIEYIGE